jgi:choline transporter-like protein 2/4/5
LIKVTRTIKPAQSDPIYNLLTSNVAVVTRWFGDLQLSIPAVFMCGGVLAVVLSLLFMVALQFFAKYIVWCTIWLTYLLLICLTVVLANWGGLFDQEGQIRGFVAEVVVSTTSLSIREKDEFSRTQDYYRWSSYVVMAVDFILLCLICFWRDKIGIAVGIIREASRCIRQMPFILIFPFFPCLIGIATMSAWIVTAGYIASSGEADPMWEYLPDALAMIPGNFTGATSVFSTNKVKAQTMLFHIFGLLWTQQFFFGIGVMTIAGAVAEYYWQADKSGIRRYNIWPVAESFGRAVRYHMGSVALGSLIIAILEMLRGVLFYMDRQTRKLQEKSCAIKVLFRCVHCFMWCFEKCVRFVSKNGYIIIAIKGGSFCSRYGSHITGVKCAPNSNLLFVWCDFP